MAQTRAQTQAGLVLSANAAILSLMGIDVWVLRGDTELLDPVVVASASTQPQSATGVISESTPAQPPEGAKNDSVGVASLDLIRQQLGQIASPDTAPKVLSKRPEPASPKPVHVVSSQADEFLFLFIDYTEHSVVLSLPYGSASLPTDYRFFIDDIARALGDPGLGSDAGGVVIRDLSWPMLQASHIQHSQEDAEALVLQRIMPSRNFIIAFGELAEKYLTAIKPKIEDKQLVYTSAIETHFKNPPLKAQLWQQLRPFLAYLKMRHERP